MDFALGAVSIRAASGNQWVVLLAVLTRIGITGTSVKTPTTVASAAPDVMPNKKMATVTESSKKLLAPRVK